jgi:nicotinate phosphoribosyltransferase
MDIVEVEGVPCAKRGKLGGKKQVWRCKDCLSDIVKPSNDVKPKCKKCGGEVLPMLRPLLKNGKNVSPLPEPSKIREYVLEQLKQIRSLHDIS